MAKKRPEKDTSLPVVPIRGFKPENCLDHYFVVEVDGRVDIAASFPITDDSICLYCGLYFSTWMSYSNAINKSYAAGSEDEIKEIINLLKTKIAKTKTKTAISWGENFLSVLTTRQGKKRKNERL
jgi:hypothetical protein